MERPQTKNIDKVKEGWSVSEQVGYNQACNDWEGYHNHILEKLAEEKMWEEILDKEYYGGHSPLIPILSQRIKDEIK